MRKRNIKKLMLMIWISDDILPSIGQNATEMERLQIWFHEIVSARNLMSLAQLRKLKHLELYCVKCDNKSTIALIKELSINTELETFAVGRIRVTNEFCDALSNLTNLKGLQLMRGTFKLNGTKSIEMLLQKLSKLESLMLVDCFEFPCREFLSSICKSVKLRAFYIFIDDIHETNNFIEEISKFSMNGMGHHCLVSGNPLCLHINGLMIDRMTEDNFKSIERYGNIKIFLANRDVFPLWRLT